jgi:hypothetical protein
VLTRDESDGETATYRAITSGVPAVMAGIKSLLDTGEPLAIPQWKARPADLRLPGILPYTGRPPGTRGWGSAGTELGQPPGDEGAFGLRRLEFQRGAERLGRVGWPAGPAQQFGPGDVELVPVP